ncbi:MAG TPA: hypothetical protein DDY98_05920 [Ruminococcaceae bacterium]|nr:hypothetical protein [Oscillospiraceae bacterium]
MAYIRAREEERTGYQSGSELLPAVDHQCDFVMVYRLNETTAERVKMYRDKGYVVHLMTGISWGAYLDYLEGRFDGATHWDEAQTDRFGNVIAHGVDVPYMVPSVGFADFLTERLKIAVDAGVEAIHVEEPEFWDRGGYSEGFKREYELFYREPWMPPHESVDARYRCAKLKAYLFTRTIDRVSAGIKEYAKKKYNRNLRFYVPTHSLINYTQWQIVSPEGKLADIPGVDGCIAQVWTGTSRTMNWFNGVRRERTFETAFLEYGVMQELVKGTGRRMWFLHDPIEDNPIFDWNDYETNYYCTVAASLLHPKVNRYEICPWPNRVFYEKYPKNAENAEEIPASYRTKLNNMFQTLGTLEEAPEEGLRVGILTGDCQLYQRDYPDCCYTEKAAERVGTVLFDDEETAEKFRTQLFPHPENRELMLRYMASSAFPGFYSLALPLLKYGVGVRPVLLDNARRYPGYLHDYDVLVLSYEFMKPEYPDINVALAEWVQSGGTLIYIGDGFDPYNGMKSWWSGSYKNPAEHLFRMLGVEVTDEKTVTACGKGAVGVWLTNPCLFSFSKQNADGFRAFFEQVCALKSFKPAYKNYLKLQRNEYLIAAVMDESINDNELKISGIFSDMFDESFAVVHEKALRPNDKCMLLDYSKIEDETLRVIGTSVRVEGMEQQGDEIHMTLRGAGEFTASLRVRTPFAVKSAELDGEEIPCEYDSETRTVLLRFASVNRPRALVLKK